MCLKHLGIFPNASSSVVRIGCQLCLWHAVLSDTIMKIDYTLVIWWCLTELDYTRQQRLTYLTNFSSCQLFLTKRKNESQKFWVTYITLCSLVIIHMAINYSEQSKNVTTESTASIPSCVSCMNSVLDSVIWNSPFSMGTRLQAGWAGFISQQRVEFFFSLLPGPVLGPTHPHSRRVQRTLSLEVKSQSVKLTLSFTGH